MSAINERVSDLIHSEIADFFAGFGSPGEPEIQNGDAQKQLSARIDAILQQYRAAAEPVCPKCGGTGMADSGGFQPWGEPILIECDCHAAPQVTSVPDEVARAIEKLKQELVNCNRYNYCLEAVNQLEKACRAAMLESSTRQAPVKQTAAPAVQSEPLSVDTLANVLRNAPSAPSDSQGKKRGNSPVIPDGYALVPVEPTKEMMLHKSGCQRHAWDDADCPMRQTRRLVWGRMIEAVPKQEAQEVKK
ncbi:hypothetical protein PO486_06285 [Atlantibacter hermannii]|uniref:hypothetical protein n=1 Tax=Atlantibacter hermannii TaxID=565 RepID=UPI002FFA504F